jgi:hypothetical protein
MGPSLFMKLSLLGWLSLIQSNRMMNASHQLGRLVSWTLAVSTGGSVLWQDPKSTTIHALWSLRSITSSSIHFTTWTIGSIMSVRLFSPISDTAWKDVSPTQGHEECLTWITNRSLVPEPLRAYNGLCGPDNGNATCVGTDKQCCNKNTWICGDTLYVPEFPGWICADVQISDDCAINCYEGNCY